jgi:hypothetical protein
MPIGKEQLPYAWPPKCRLNFYDGRDNLLFSSTDRLFDLFDNVMLAWPHNSRTIYFGISTTSSKWPKWSEEAIEKMEWLINYDFSCDGYKVKKIRLSETDCLPCAEEFRWKLVIKDM